MGKKSADGIDAPGQGAAVHVAILSELVMIYLRRHDFENARLCLSALVPRYHVDEAVRRMIFRAGFEVLQRVPDNARACLSFLDSLVSLDTREREGIVLELAAYRLRIGQRKEVYEQLQSYIHLDPYQKNPLYHGYYGIAALALAAEDEEDAVDGAHLRLRSAKLQKAVRHLRIAAGIPHDLNGPPLHTLSTVDLGFFLMQYLQALELGHMEGWEEEAEAALAWWGAHHPQHPSGPRMLAAFLLRHGGPSRRAEVEACMRGVLRLDPAATDAFAWLVEHYREEDDDASVERAARLAATRLDYVPRDSRAWDVLCEACERLVVERDWQTDDFRRLLPDYEWWCSHHFCAIDGELIKKDLPFYRTAGFVGFLVAGGKDNALAAAVTAVERASRSGKKPGTLSARIAAHNARGR